MDGDTLGNLRLTWYSNIDPGETVAIVNTLWQRADAGETVFYDLYSQEEKAADPAKEDTGLFSSKANPEPGLRYVMPEAGSLMWEPCRTAFPCIGIVKSRLQCLRSDLPPRCSDSMRDLARPSALSLNMRRNWRWIRTATPCGEAPRERRMAAWMGTYGQRRLRR